MMKEIVEEYCHSIKNRMVSSESARIEMAKVIEKYPLISLLAIEAVFEDRHERFFGSEFYKLVIEKIPSIVFEGRAETIETLI